MRRSVPDGIKFAALIFLPLLAAGAVIVWLCLRLISGISESVDLQEHERAWQAAQSAFRAEERRLGSVLIDNAHWGEAVQHSYAPVDESWIEGMWGLTTGDSNYDTFMILQRDGKTLIAYRKGARVELDAATYVGAEQLRNLIAEMPADNTSFRSVTTLTVTPDGPMVLAAGTIVPNGEENVSVPSERSSILLLGHHVTASDLIFMGNQYIVDRMAFTGLGDPEQGQGILRDHWGKAIARLTWQDRHPGIAASETQATSAALLLAGFIGLIFPISLLHFRSTTQLSKSQRNADYASRHDRLTGIANRVSLHERLEQALGGSAARDLVLIYVDLDGFKNVNDAYGHEAGDQLLRLISSGLSTIVAPHLAVRLGGDEFAVLVTGHDCEVIAETLARSITSFVREPFDLAGRSALVGASLGLARGEQGMTPVELMRRADIAMYDAKDNGRGLWTWFDPSLDEKRAEDLEIAAEMRELVAKGEFDLAYQPIVNSNSRKITGVEVLARWPKASARKLTPDRFIAIAEEHGIIDELGKLVARKACRDMVQLQDITLAINVSPTQLSNKSFTASLLKIAREEKFDLRRLEVEFTESVLIRNPSRAKAVITELHEKGVRVALDDFGIGYASVGYLREFGFDKVKLDRSLTQSILNNSNAQKVVQGTVLIALGLSAEIVAEGVEREEEAQIMRLSGCHSLQGFYLGRPQPIEHLRSLLVGAQSAGSETTAEPVPVLA